MSKSTKPGPKSKITVALVKRVSGLVAKGIPIRMALANESVTQHAYERQLRRHPELRAIQTAAKIRFLNKTFDMILTRPGPLLKWFLERRHPEMFAAPRQETPAPAAPAASAPAPEEPTQTIAGIPEHLVEQARQKLQYVQNVENAQTDETIQNENA